MTRPASPLLDQSALDALDADWQAITDRAAAAVNDWEAAFIRIADEEDKLRSAGRWVHGRDDFFGVLGIEDAEIRHSAMLAWLFDPCGRHGLGTRVLRHFLLTAFGECPSASLAGARTRCEAPVDGGRVDILVDAPGLLLVIENKVGAGEGNGQCDAYYEFFNCRSGACFVFLTPDGRKPTSATGDAQQAYRQVSYRQVRQALEQALDEVGSATVGPTRGRHIAEDYLITLQREFP